MTKLELVQLRNKAIVRPAHGLGTCGWSPKAWQVSIPQRGESIISAFLRNNPNWSREEVSYE